MVFRPEVFLSATPRELDACRDVVKATLREIGAHPVEHTDLSTPYGPLDGILKVAIGQCDAVIHLTAFAFGAEPPDRTHGAPRRSTAQFEYDVARAMHREVLSFVARPGTPVAALPPDDDDARALQSAHRRGIEKGGEHWTFASPEDLAGLIRALRPRIMVRRRYARLPFPPRGRQLFGRERWLGELRDTLAGHPVVLIEPPAQFATTSASAGKTVLAVEAAWRLFDQGRFDFVFWLPAVSGADLEGELAALTHGDALALVKDEIAGHALRLEAIRRWFLADERAGRFLVILDGVDHEVTWLAVESILPWFARGSLLITTRLPRELPGAARLSAGALATEAAVALLAARLFGRDPTPAEQKPLEQIAAALGSQPFALQLAARFMADARESPQHFLAALTAPGDTAPSPRAPQVSRWLPVLDRLIRRSAARLDSQALALLHVLVCLAPQPAGIPQAIFAGKIDAPESRAALGHIEKLGLVAFADDGHTVLVHRLVREVIHDRLTPEESAAALDTGRALMEAALERTERSPGAALLRTRLVPHCRVLLGQLNGHPLEIRAGRLARGVAGWLRESGRLSAAEHFQRRALAIAERACEPGHPDLIPELRLLAAILQDRRRFEDAAALHRRAIGIIERQPGSHSTDLVAELFALASCLRSGGRLREAEPVLLRALETEERSSGRMHARTAIAAHTLASLLEVLHRPADAVPYYRRALEIDEQLPHCPPARHASRLHHLAAALADSGELAAAIPLHERALTFDSQAFGADHPELIAPLQQLAALYELQARHADAAARLRRALAIHERHDSQPLDLASTLTSLAIVLAASGARTDAEPHCRRALALLDHQPDWHPLAQALRRECEALRKT